MINIEVVKMDKRDPLIKAGRLRVEVDSALVLQLIDDEGYGWAGAAQEYTRRIGYWTCKDTIKRRYREAKSKQKLLQGPLEKLKCKDEP